MKNKKNSLFQGKAMHPFIPLLFMVILCTVISYFVAPGAYDRETVNGVTDLEDAEAIGEGLVFLHKGKKACSSAPCKRPYGAGRQGGCGCIPSIFL